MREGEQGESGYTAKRLNRDPYQQVFKLEVSEVKKVSLW